MFGIRLQTQTWSAVQETLATAFIKKKKKAEIYCYYIWGKGFQKVIVN